jgi:hypothetical protein
MNSSSKLLLPWDNPPSKGALDTLCIPEGCFTPYFQEPPQNDDLFDLPSLRRTWIEKAVCFLYRNVCFPHPPKVTLLTWVIGDGLGDFSAQLEAAKLLLDLNIDLSLISFYPNKMPLQDPHLPCAHIFIPYQEDKEGTWSNIPKTPIPLDAQKILSACDVFLQMPTFFPYTHELLSFMKHAPYYELIGEGGWGATPRFCPKNGFRSMGLHSWEKGLFFSKINPCFPDVTLPPGKLFFGYLRYPSSCLLFLQTALLIEKKNHDPILLYVFPSEGILQQIQHLTSFCKECGIQRIDIYYKNSFCSIPIQKNGKKLTIMQIDKTPRDKYQALLSQSFFLAGCRGDGSLTETLLANKVPFFDFPLHKKPLLEGLYCLAKHHLSYSHPTSAYIKEFLFENPNPMTLATLLQIPTLFDGFTSLLTILKKHYNMADFVPNLILRAACHRFYPLTALQEKVILQPFLNGEKEAIAVLQEIQDMIIHTL